MLRLAGGTDESRPRMIRAVDDVWPYVDELFRDEPLIDRLDGIAVRPSALRDGFDEVIAAVFAEAELELPEGFVSSGGGRQGKHFSTSGLPARRDAGARAAASGGDLVTVQSSSPSSHTRASTRGRSRRP